MKQCSSYNSISDWKAVITGETRKSGMADHVWRKKD